MGLQSGHQGYHNFVDEGIFPDIPGSTELELLVVSWSVDGSWRTLVQPRPGILYPVAEWRGEVGGAKIFRPWGLVFSSARRGAWGDAAVSLRWCWRHAEKTPRYHANAGISRAFFLVDRMALKSGHHVFLGGQSIGGNFWTNFMIHSRHVLSVMPCIAT